MAYKIYGLFDRSVLDIEMLTIAEAIESANNEDAKEEISQNLFSIYNNFKSINNRLWQK